MVGVKRSASHSSVTPSISTHRSQSVSTQLQEIQQYHTELLNDKSHVNHILKLYQYTTLSPDQFDSLQLIVSSLTVLSHVYTTYRHSGDLVNTNTDTSAIQKYKQWLQKQYKQHINQVYDLLHNNDNEQLQNCVVQLLCDDVTAQARTDSQALQPQNSVLHRLLQQILLTYNLHQTSFTLLNKYIQSYTDVRYYVLLHIRQLLQKPSKQWQHMAKKLNSSDKIQQNRLLHTVSHNVCHILSSYSSIKSEQYTEPPYLCKTHPSITEQQYKQQLSSTWLSYLSNDQLQHRHDTYVYTLSLMHSTILPCVETPLLLCDYLTDSYNVGGVTAILALHGLFDLIYKHNLDYPNFYDMLYKLCGDHQIYYSPYRVTFYKLLHTFLTSNYIPSHMIASFMKRLARIALTTSAPSTYYILSLLHAIVQRHKSVKHMLYGHTNSNHSDISALLQQHQQHATQSKLYDIQVKRTVSTTASTDSDSDNDADSVLSDQPDNNYLPPVDLDAIIAQASAGNKQTYASTNNVSAQSNKQDTLQALIGADPFDATTDDTKQTHALQSSLWEVATLSHHYITSIAILASSLLNEQTNKLAIEIDDYIDCTYSTLYAPASKYKQAQKSHLYHTKPTLLFDTTDIFKCIF